jgi:flagellar hook-basal body complex protein FliE
LSVDVGAVRAVSAADFGPAAEAAPGGSAAFGRLVDDLLVGHATQHATADQAVQNLATGRADNLHEVSLAVAQADLSFRLLLELRNRATEAYQEVMRMQV